MNNNKVILGVSLILFFSVLIEMIIVVSTYNIRKEKLKEVPIVLDTPSTLTIIHDKTNEINMEDLYSGMNKSLSFSVKNSSTINAVGNYKVNLEIVEPIIVKEKNDFVYDLICYADSSNTISSSIPLKSNIRVPSSTGGIGYGKLVTGVTHNCTLTFKFTADKELYDGKKFHAKINIKSVVK